MDSSPNGVRTLAIDIGGSGIKAAVLSGIGERLSDRVRVDTPRPAETGAVLDAISTLVEPLRPFDRAAVGFPGVVIDGVVLTAANLDGDWKGVPLASLVASRLGCPARAANDADMQGLAAIEGRGVELVITLGTGVGSALFLDGRLVPNLEMGHHPFRKGDTYEEQLGYAALETAGRRRWNKRLRRAIERLRAAFNFRVLYFGGGNAKAIKGKLPAGVKIVSNELGVIGGAALWRD